MEKNDYHDKEITGVFYDKEKKKLTFYFADKGDLSFNNIIQFELNFFSDENVLFDIEIYTMNNVPKILLKDYPFLSNYHNNRNNHLIIYYLNPSVGISGIIITDDKTL